LRKILNYPWLKHPMVIENDVQNPSPQKSYQLNKRMRRMIRDFVPQVKEEDASSREHRRPTIPKKPKEVS